MPDITFFHTERADRGRRTGIWLDGAEAVEQYVPGDEDAFDPVIRWYVDVICPLSSQGANREVAIEWFVDNRERIRAAIAETANRLDAGLDIAGAPWSFDWSDSLGPLRVVMSAQRRMEARNVADELRRFLTGDWQSFSKAFPIPASTAA